MSDVTAGAVVPAVSQNAKLVSRQKKEGKEEVLLRLERNDPTLTCIMTRPGKSKDGAYVRPQTEEDWRRLGEAVATNTNLQRLDLIDFQLDIVASRCLRAFFSKLNDNRAIRRLGLSGLHLHSGEMLTHLDQFLEKNTCLTSLHIDYCDIGLGAIHFYHALSTMGGKLRYLDLSKTNNEIRDCEYLMEGIAAHIPSLRSLELKGNALQDEACDRILTFILTNPNSALVRLYLDNNRIGDVGAVTLAEGLAQTAHGGRLKTLSLTGNYRITAGGYEAFLRTVCNSPDIDNIMRSNHTLQRLEGDLRHMPDELLHYLHLNKACNKAHVASQKVVLHHFAYNCNLELFEGIPGSLLPNVLAMISEHEDRPTGKNERTDAEAATHNALGKKDYTLRHRALHRIVRRCPWICERRTDAAGGDGRASTAERESAAKKAKLS